MRFAVISDLHFPSRKLRATAFVNAISTRQSVQFVVATGDLTDKGTDGGGVTACSCLSPLFKNGPGSKEDQLGEYVECFEAPLRALGKKVYAVPGNSDVERVGCLAMSPVRDFLCGRYGNTHYVIERGGVKLVFCDVYPNAEVLAWMSLELRFNVNPVIFFFHFNLVGENSDWWTQKEKDAFRDAIAGMRVLGIFVGHQHSSYAHTWYGYDVYCTGGENSWATVVVNEDRSKLMVTF